MLDASLYGELVIGAKGLIQQRLYIMEQWPEGKHIVFLDDDVVAIDLNMSFGFKEQTLDYFFQEAFQEIQRRRSYLWGVDPVFNRYFRDTQQEIKTYLALLVGPFYSIINRPNLKSVELALLADSNSSKEDALRSIFYFVQDGIVVRFSRIGLRTK